jgi:hypothetical protein
MESWTRTWLKLGLTITLTSGPLLYAHLANWALFTVAVAASSMLALIVLDRRNGQGAGPISPVIWTDAQVERLNGYQRSRQFHPYTCPGELKVCEDKRELVATRQGWVCQCGRYRQDWAHEMHLGAPEADDAGGSKD